MMIHTRALRPGDTIGFASPCSLATEEGFAPILEAARAMGYRVKPARNLYAHGWDYAASAQERADDLNQLIHDEEVRLIFFGGGEGADEVLPLLDFAAAAAHPKRWCSYSDGTTILNTVWARTGIVTYYGQMPGILPGFTAYNRAQFERFLTAEALPTAHQANSAWRTLCGGQAEGTLIGGYVDNFLYLLGNGWVVPQADARYLLFLEDHEKFFQMPHESNLLTRLEQSRLMPQVTGLVFGHYSDPVNPQLLARLRRLGESWHIPVCYCDDFGHGVNHAILPIGAHARLDADAQTLRYAV